MDERRERNPDTGENIYIKTGAGIGDIFVKVAAKITGKTAKRLATKAAEKVIEKVQKKLVSLLEKKSMVSFPQKRREPLSQQPQQKQKGKKLSIF